MLLRLFSWLALLVFLALGQIAKIASNSYGLRNPDVAVWYRGLVRPPFEPPGYVFGIVWEILYVALGVAGFLFFDDIAKYDVGDEVLSRALTSEETAGLSAFLSVLVLGVAWSLVFFRLKSIGGGAILIFLHFAAAVATAVLFFFKSLPAGILMIIYSVWALFAVALNFYRICAKEKKKYIGVGDNSIYV